MKPTFLKFRGSPDSFEPNLRPPSQIGKKQTFTKYQIFVHETSPLPKLNTSIWHFNQIRNTNINKSTIIFRLSQVASVFDLFEFRGVKYQARAAFHHTLFLRPQ